MYIQPTLTHFHVNQRFFCDRKISVMSLSKFTVLGKCRVCYLKRKIDTFLGEKYQNQLTKQHKASRLPTAHSE